MRPSEAGYHQKHSNPGPYNNRIEQVSKHGASVATIYEIASDKSFVQIIRPFRLKSIFQTDHPLVIQNAPKLCVLITPIQGSDRKKLKMIIQEV
jgi:hypothetical protein